MKKNLVPKVPTQKGKVGNTKQPSPALKWCFTMFNYNDDHIKTFINLCVEQNLNYLFEKEICPDTGNPHLQGYIYTEIDKFRPFTIFKKDLEWISWRSCSGTHKSNVNYCTKDFRKTGDLSLLFSNFYKPPRKLKLLNPDHFYPWQKDLLTLSKTEPDDRSIIWIYDPITSKGKTSFTKYMFSNEGAVVFTGGTREDIACVLADSQENGKDLNQITTMIFNFSMEQDKISYIALEQLKDGLITNTKYHSLTLSFNNPHLFIFSNFLPNCKSLNRKGVWNIKTINEKNELVNYERPEIDTSYA